jgi:CheY-like chemotaxis protein
MARTRGKKRRPTRRDADPLTGMEAPESLHAPTILIVEDESHWHTNLQHVLQPQGFRLLHAFDYSDALKQLQQRNPPPELAIVDLKLPSSLPQHLYDGLTVLTALRQKGIYALVLSGVLREVAETIAQRPEVYEVVDKLRFADAGFLDHFLVKVHTALTHALACRRAEGQLHEQQERLDRLPLPS